jgi:HAMP domain-containing protein
MVETWCRHMDVIASWHLALTLLCVWRNLGEKNIELGEICSSIAKGSASRTRPKPIPGPRLGFAPHWQNRDRLHKP